MKYNDVKTFMNAVGHDAPSVPVPENDLSSLYKRLIDEEYGEFKEADGLSDDVERIDACFDMLWVILAYMYSRGWDIESIWEEGAKSNLSKIDPDTGLVIRRPEDGKILKPADWAPPNFKQFTDD